MHDIVSDTPHCSNGEESFFENSSKAHTVNVYSFIVPFLGAARYLEIFIEK